MSAPEPVVVVGGGLAGAKAAQTLRSDGFDGRVVLVAGEPEVPYERPPLSKDYLLGKADRESPRVHPAHWYAEQDVDLRLGESLSSLADLNADVVVIATGARPRQLDDALQLRTLDDSLPIVMLSGEIDDDIARRTVAAGATRYFSKPFDFDALERTISDAVEAGREHALAAAGTAGR
jgi:NADPH-dependent 2,4-dienoyl-CoA reductase/sulfur reductase-like enzyme